MHPEQPVSPGERASGVVRVVVAGLIWGSIPLLTRAADGASVVKVFFRVACAGLVVASWMVVTGRIQELKRLPLRKWRQLLGQGAILTLNWFLFLTALDLTNVATAELLAYTGPVIIAALAPFVTGERFDRRVVLPLSLALGGIVIILAPQGLAVHGGRELLGAVLAFLSALTYATLMLRSKKILTGVTSGALMLVEYGFASILLLPFVAFAFARGDVPSTTLGYGALVTLGVVHTAFAGFLFLGGLRRVRTDRVAILTYIEPMSAVLFAALLLGEALRPNTIAGGVLVVAGGLLVARLESETGTVALPLEAQRGEESNDEQGHIASDTTTGRSHSMAALERLIDADAIRRLSAKDASLFSREPEVMEKVSNRLGWTDLAARAVTSMPQIERLAQQARDEGVNDIVLLGMGGSSLASLVLSRVLGGPSPRLHVLDTVSPVTIDRVLRSIDPARTLYLVSSKSGGTIEPNTLYAIFRDDANASLGEEAGDRFIAITDPGSSLEQLARDERFRDVVVAPSDVGGRFSALSVFGLVPAALMGLDVPTLIERGRSAEEACAASFEENPAAELARFIVDSAGEKADKLTIVAAPRLRSFGLWVEQLVAESLGKEGQGVVPVVELSDSPRGYGPDRAVVVVRMTGDARLAEWAAAHRGRHPVYEIVFDDGYDVAEEFVRWEYAIALSGFLFGINPFDEPNVAEAKEATVRVLEGAVSPPLPQVSANGIDITFAGSLESPAHHEHSLATALGHVVAAAETGDYIALLAYLPDDDALLSPLQAAVSSLAAESGSAVCLEVGPRYLHSTGQLHKGGPNSGVFVLVTTQDETDIEVPGRPWGLRALHRAQAEGDLITLTAHNRRVLWVDLPDASAESIETLSASLLDAAGVVREGATL